MKKLGKLSINPEKIINDNELLNLRGGSSSGCGTAYACCQCKTSTGTYAAVGYDYVTESECRSDFGYTLCEASQGSTEPDWIC